jgi:hypothetical protein
LQTDSCRPPPTTREKLVFRQRILRNLRGKGDMSSL